MAIFRLSKMAAGAILDFQTFTFSTVGGFRRSNCVAVPNLVEIDQTIAEIWRFFLFFQDGGLVGVCTTHEGCLVVFITVQNLV